MWEKDQKYLKSILKNIVCIHCEKIVESFYFKNLKIECAKCIENEFFQTRLKKSVFTMNEFKDVI